MNKLELRYEIERDEGRRTKLYKDSEGILTIGVGWNIEDRGLPQSIIDKLLDISLDEAERDAAIAVSCFKSLSEVRQRVLINMAFNLGLTRLQGFKKMIAAVNDGDYVTAAKEMLDSKWSNQVGKRATRLAKMMETCGA